MSVFFRKGDKVRLLTIEELRNKCYSVKNDWGGLWVIEYHGSPQVHAYLQNEIYLLGSKGEVVASGYEPFVAVNVQGYGTINIPPVCLEKIEVIPELDESAIDDVVQIMIEEDEIDIAHILDGYTRDDVFIDEGIYGFKTLQEMAKEHKNAEATPFVLESEDDSLDAFAHSLTSGIGTYTTLTTEDLACFNLEGNSEDIEPKDTSERLADLYTEVVLVKIHLDEILKQIDELLKQEREKE